VSIRALTNIEEIKNTVENENEPQRVWSPLGTITNEYFYRKCRTKLSKGMRNEMYPINYLKRLNYLSKPRKNFSSL
jgi:hypothetical protein